MSTPLDLPPSADGLPEPARLFPPEPWRRLLQRLGVSDPPAWVSRRQRDLERLGEPQVHPSLLWGAWLPLLEHCRLLLATGERRVLGLNGPTGVGKSTLMAFAAALAEQESLPIAVASIDDFYLPWQRRVEALVGNPFGVWRGPPGSHEPQLALAAIRAWRQGEPLRLPRFDKRLRGGEGDRQGAWEGTPRLLLLEGWLVGCRPLDPADLEQLLEGDAPTGLAGGPLTPAERRWLPCWNGFLAGYEPLWGECSALWQLRPACWSSPRRWRLQAEARQRRRGGDTLPPERLQALVRACQASLPPAWYQELEADAVAVLDGRRRCLWSGTGLEAAERQLRSEPQSSDSASSATG
ncbi:MAG: hypothetical protein ACOVNL_02065 [Prochlorococcaceae cyanobacterium]